MLISFVTHLFHLFFFCRRFIDFQSIDSIYKEYHAEVIKLKKCKVTKSYFAKLWQDMLREGVVDPSDGVIYSAQVHKKHCRGFGLCNRCELLKSLASSAKKQENRNAYRALHKEHLQEVHDDRCELARLARYTHSHTNTHTCGAVIPPLTALLTQVVLCRR